MKFLKAFLVLVAFAIVQFTILQSNDKISAQTVCNSPSGFVKVRGPFTPGDVPILDVDCFSLIDGGPISGAGVISSKSANYTVLNADDHSTIFLTGTTANQTITISALGSYADNHFSVQVCNRSNHRWTITSVDSGSLFLWPGSTGQPGQCNSMISNGTVLSFQTPQQRFRNFQGTYFLGAAGTCSDSNDGLTPDIFGQICTGNTLVSLLQQHVDGAGSNPLIQLGNGTYSQGFSIAATSPCCADGIAVQGNVATPSNTVVLAPNNTPAFAARDYTAFLVQSLTIGCINVGSGGLVASQFGVIDSQNVTYGSCTNNAMAFAQDGGHIDFTGGNIINGNGSVFCLAQGAASECSMTNQSFTCVGAPAFSFFAEANQLGFVNAGGATFSGCGAVAGQRYIAGYNGMINTNAGGANFFPGNVAGATSTGGQYN